MKISNIHVDGFGVWNGLRLSDLSDRMTVFYGANEAGKTTLMQFVRAMLYGVSDSRRQRYLSASKGTNTGGLLFVTAANGAARIERHPTLNSPNESHLKVTSADGTVHGEHLLKNALHDVDETTFNNIFAVGLRELQELGTLCDTEAADWLYSLTAGLDRVSILDVLHDLDTSRRELLSDDESSQIVELLLRRDALQAEVDELSTCTARWQRLAEERQRLGEEVVRIEQESNRLESQARAIEAAIAVKDKWQERAGVERQLTEVGRPAPVAEDAIERIDRLNARIERRRQQRTSFRDERHRLRDEALALGVNRRLWHNAPRLEALAEQQQWIVSLQSQADQAEQEADEMEAQIASHFQAAGVDHIDSTWTTLEIPRQVIPSLRAPARNHRAARGRLATARNEAAAARQEVDRLSDELRAGLAARSQTDLSTALEVAGARVAQFRRRVQLDERLNQSASHQREIEQQSRDLLHQQLMPMWVLGALGGLFALGFALVLAATILPALQSIGLTLSVLGAVGVGVAVTAKFIWDRSNLRQTEACERQLSMLSKQLEQMRLERDQLDAELPAGGGPLTARLHAAEGDLAQLEDILPLDARRKAAEQDAVAADQRAATAESDVRTARHDWQGALSAAHLPVTLTPKQVRAIVDRGNTLGSMRSRLMARREEARQRRAELASTVDRMHQLADDAGLTLVGDTVADKLRHLLRELGQQRTAIARREELRQMARRFKRKEARCRREIEQWQARRRAMFHRAGAESEAEFRRLVLQSTRVRLLEQQHDTLDAEIRSVVDNSDLVEIGAYLDPDAVDQLEAHWESITVEIDACRGQLQKALQRQGALDAQRQELAADGRLAELQLDLGVVDHQLQAAIDRWQVLAVTSLLLESIREEYEQHRQPETLVEASGFLQRLTEDRYTRVWTPLDQDVLLVDDSSGHSLAVDALSRGTREQLFLSLRLALVEMYARRGVQLPLVLDDVLVNFDAERAKAAARVLRDFSKRGHQILVFTCHEHVWKMFKSMKVDARRLPDRSKMKPDEQSVVTTSLDPLPVDTTPLHQVLEEEHANERQEYEEVLEDVEDEVVLEDDAEDDEEEYEYEEDEAEEEDADAGDFDGYEEDDLGDEDDEEGEDDEYEEDEEDAYEDEEEEYLEEDEEDLDQEDPPAEAA